MDDLPSTLTIDGAAYRMAAILAGDACCSADQLDELADAAERHGVLPLLASLTNAERARAVLRDAIASDAALTDGLTKALDALGGAGIRAIVLKGAHLAVTHYRAPYLRPRSDADLFIVKSSRGAVRQELERIGFALVPHVRGDLILTQMHFTHQSNGFLHALDVHWRALNPHAFRDLLPFEDAWTRSVPIAALGEPARGLCNADAMLLATTHLAAHHPGDARLIWIMDIDRLAAVMTRDAWDDFVRRACAARAARVALVSLSAAALLLHTIVPPDVGEALARDDADQRATTVYLRRTTRAQRLWSEIQQLPGWQTRAQYLRQHLIPDRAYMRHAYGGSVLLLPWHYLARAATGAVRWVKR